jgi:hypothetical protein
MKPMLLEVMSLVLSLFGRFIMHLKEEVVVLLLLILFLN